MGQALVAQILPAVEKMKWSSVPQATAPGYSAYEVGIDQVDRYEGDPKVLGNALRTFQTADSRPYAYAGIAYTLVAASHDSKGNYYGPGLDAALEWLEKAQETEPDVADINMIEALIYIHKGRLADARLVLDYLHNQEPDNFYVNRAEMLYWQVQGNLEQAILWCRKSMETAKELPQRLRLVQVLGDLQMSQGDLDAALETYQEAIHFDREDPKLWHSMSVIYWEQGEFEEAARCNQKSLSVGALAEAQKMKAALDEKLGESKGGLRGRLFGR